MNDIKDNTLIIVPAYLKEEVLRKFSNSLKNVKVMTFNSFLDNFLFTYDEKTIYHLMHEYNLKYDLALMYLKNLKLIENKEYKAKKIRKLVNLKKYLDDKNLLIYNLEFKNVLKRKNVIFYQLEQNKYNEFIINQVKKITNVSVINSTYNNNYSHEIYEFKDCDEELEFVAENICELLKNGINIKNITLLNVNEETLISLKRIFNLFNIPINIPENNYIISTKMVSFFLNNMNSDINKTFNLIKDNFDLKKAKNLDIYNQLIGICNKYTWIDNYLLAEDLISHDLKSTKVKVEKIDNAVKVQNLEEYEPKNEDYVFLLDFNQGIVPFLESDNDFINDSIKEELNLNNTLEKNDIHNKKTLEVIKNTKNMWISYIKSSKNGELQLSTLNKSLNYPVIHSNKKYYYSNLNNLMTLGKNLDTFLAYGTKSEELINLYSNYSDIKYRTFDNKFTGIDKKLESLTLSYSSLDNYYKCAFRYYVSSVLKLNIYEENFANYLGSLFHFVLSKYNELSLDDSWNLFLQDNHKEFTNKEKFFLEKGKEELKLILEVLNKQKDYTTFNEEVYETRIEIEKEKNVKFVGIIDKIMFNQQRNLCSIIDYKTGNPNLNLNNISYGLSLQLPIYLYLVNNKYPDIEIVGFYLQKILPSLIIKDQVKSLEDQRRELLKLQGYSLSNESKLSQFDKTYMDSSLIKSLKMGNNGFYAYSKTLTSKEITNIIKLVDEKINEAIKNIKENKFDINPKHVGKENLGCAFCKFKDICYMNNKDVMYLEEIKDLSFLGGDNDAKLD